MKLSSLVNAVKQDLPITLRHERWLQNHSNAPYSKEALAFAGRMLSGHLGNKRDRSKSFSASGMNSCQRRRTFEFLGMPRVGVMDSGLSNIFLTGHFLHLKWQMAGLTEGWLRKAEVPLLKAKWKMRGTMDGVLFDNSGFEFKSINNFGFSSVMQHGPTQDHIAQVHAYMWMAPEIEKFSIVYESKETSEWREFRIERNPIVMQKVEQQIYLLNESLIMKTLPRVLPVCETRDGRTYNSCPYREICLEATWPN